MRYAIINSGIVENVTLWDGNTATWQPPADSIAVPLADDSPVGPGHTYDGAVFTAPAPEPAPVPSTIGPAQLRVALWTMHGISPDTLAATVAAVLGQLDGPTRTIAQMQWDYATECQRANPLVGVVGRVLGLSTEQVDDVYRLGATI